MRCRYCNKAISLLRRLNDSAFCSDAHRIAHAEEQQMALQRLFESPNGAGRTQKMAAFQPKKALPVPVDAVRPDSDSDVESVLPVVERGSEEAPWGEIVQTALPSYRPRQWLRWPHDVEAVAHAICFCERTVKAGTHLRAVNRIYRLMPAAAVSKRRMRSMEQPASRPETLRPGSVSKATKWEPQEPDVRSGIPVTALQGIAPAAKAGQKRESEPQWNGDRAQTLFPCPASMQAFAGFRPLRRLSAIAPEVLPPPAPAAPARPFEEFPWKIFKTALPTPAWSPLSSETDPIETVWALLAETPLATLRSVEVNRASIGSTVRADSLVPEIPRALLRLPVSPAAECTLAGVGRVREGLAVPPPSPLTANAPSRRPEAMNFAATYAKPAQSLLVLARILTRSRRLAEVSPPRATREVRILFPIQYVQRGAIPTTAPCQPQALPARNLANAGRANHTLCPTPASPKRRISDAGSMLASASAPQLPACPTIGSASQLARASEIQPLPVPSPARPSAPQYRHRVRCTALFSTVAARPPLLRLPVTEGESTRVVLMPVSRPAYQDWRNASLAPTFAEFVFATPEIPNHAIRRAPAIRFGGQRLFPIRNGQPLARHSTSGPAVIPLGPWNGRPLVAPSRLKPFNRQNFYLRNKGKGLEVGIREVFSKVSSPSAWQRFRFLQVRVKWFAVAVPLIAGIWMVTRPVVSKPATPAQQAVEAPAMELTPGNTEKEALEPERPAAVGKAWERPVKRETPQANAGLWDGFQARVSGRASVEMIEDFRTGLSQWDGRGEWARSWSYDRSGTVRPGNMAFYQPSITLRDYVFEMKAAVERRSIQWMVRATGFRNYHFLRLNIAPGAALTRLELERWPVVNGKAGKVTRLPLPHGGNHQTLYAIRTAVSGDTITTYLGDQVIDTFADSRLAEGGIGLAGAPGDQPRIYALRLAHQNDFLGKLCSFLAPRPMNIQSTE